MDTASAQRRAWGLVLLAVLLVWAAANVGIGLYRAVTDAGDLRLRYEEWCVLIGRGDRVNGYVVPAARQQGWWLPYHPLTYVGLTPLFLAGLGPARWLFAILNLGCGVYAVRRAGQIYGLSARQQTWLAVMFGAWLSVRVTLGQGQLGLICLAFVMGAFPFVTTREAARLSLGLVKHTLVFPLYGELLLRRPRRLLWPVLIAVAPVALAIVWTGASPNAFADETRRAAGNMLTWPGGTDLCSALAPWITSTLAVQAIVWTFWTGLFGLVLVLVRDDGYRFAALLLLSLLPVYHRVYDIVVALPALAVFLQQRRHGWIALVMLTLAVRQDSMVRHLPAAIQDGLIWYYPVVILLLVAGVVVADRSRRSVVVNSS